MIKAIISDFSRTLLFPKDLDYTGELNSLHESLKDKVDYNIDDYFKLNKELLDFYKKISNHLNVYIFTTGYIQEWPSLKEKLEGVFTDIFIKKKLRLPDKSDPQVYKIIAEKVGLETDEILYIDDLQTNINAAKVVGMNVIHFESAMQAIESINNMIDFRFV